MEIVKLREVAKLQGGYAFKSQDFVSNEMPVIRIGNITDNKVTIDKDVTIQNEKIITDHPEFIVKKDDILIAMSGATVGKIGIYDKESISVLNQRVGKFVTSEKINSKYLYYVLQSTLFKKYILNNAFGCAQPNISGNQIESFKFKLYSIEEQIEIVNQLDRISKIINLKQKQLSTLDNVVKSQFVEMFENKNFELKTLNEVSIIKGEYGSGASAGEFVEGQPRYVRITDIQEDGRLSNQSIASPKNEKNIDKYILQYGDVLFARTGATVGKTYKYNEKDGYCIYAGYCIRFRLDLKICNPDYIFIYTKTDNYKKWVENKQRVVAQPNINAKEYGNDLKIPIPPIELQNKFAEFVKQVDKQKFEIQKSLEEIQKLQESLMNKYFG